MTERLEVHAGFDSFRLSAVHEPKDLREILGEENRLGHRSGRQVDENDGGGNALPFFQFLVKLDAAFEVPDQAGLLDVDDGSGLGLHEFLAGDRHGDSGRTRRGGTGETRLGTGSRRFVWGRGSCFTGFGWFTSRVTRTLIRVAKVQFGDFEATLTGGVHEQFDPGGAAFTVGAGDDAADRAAISRLEERI